MPGRSRPSADGLRRGAILRGCTRQSGTPHARTAPEVGRRGRARERLSAPTSDYSDGEGNVLTLRGSLSIGARAEYAQTLAGERGGAAATREDAERRAAELLFERLAVRWTIAGVPIERQKGLLARYRAASASERAWIRGALREHCAEHFPDVQAP
jgi:hypothetical protein